MGLDRTGWKHAETHDHEDLTHNGACAATGHVPAGYRGAEHGHHPGPGPVSSPISWPGITSLPRMDVAASAPSMNLSAGPS